MSLVLVSQLDFIVVCYPLINWIFVTLSRCFHFTFICIQFSRYIFHRFLCVVGSRGLEPPTSRLSGVRSNHLSYEPICDSIGYSVPLNLLVLTFRSGGDKRDRTADPLLAKQVLSQLSYTPVFIFTLKILFPRPSKLNNALFSLLPIT